MSKANKTSFKVGNNANPNGRPKGAYSPLRKQLLALRNRAAENVEEAFNDLWKDFKAGDPLARQIYFKELVSIPKEWMNETVVVAKKEGVSRLEAIEEVLSEFTELTHEEVLDEIKVLKAVEQKEEAAQPTDNVFSKLTDAQGRQLHLWLTTNDKEEV